MTIEPDAWLLADKEVKIAGWHASFDERGCLRAGGRVTAEVAYRAEQGAPLTAVVNDEPKWDGTISRPPLVDRGQAQLEAQGHRTRAEKATSPLLYQSRDVGLWTPVANPPYSAAGQFQAKLPVNVQPSAILWEQAAGVVINPAEGNAVAFHALGSPGGIVRVSFTMRSSFTDSNFRIEGYTDLGPTLAGLVQMGNSPMGVEVGPATRIFTIAAAQAGDDLAYLVLVWRGGTSPTMGSSWTMIYDLRVDGIATGDTFYTSDVVRDAGSRLGCDASKVQSSSVNAMPFFFQSGNWMDGVFAYMAALDDWAPPFFGADHGSGPELRYAPWGDVVWPVSLAKDVRPDLVSLELFNRVTVSYRHVDGSTKPVTVSPADIDEDDPLATYGIVNELPHISLRDPQPDDTLARAVGMNALRRVIRPRHQGRLEVASVSGATVWDLLPGHHSEITDWGPMESMELPIRSLELAQGQPAHLGIEAPATEVGLEEIAALEAARAFRTPELPTSEETATTPPEPHF